MRVRDLMSTPVVAVRAPTPIRQVIEILRDRQISAVPVVDADRRLIGLVSEGDLLTLELFDQRGQATPETVPEHAPLTAGELMTRDVVCVAPDTDAGEAAQVLAAGRLRHVPVTDGDRVVGMLSRRDLIGMLARRDAEIQAEVQELLADELGRAAPAVRVLEGELEVELSAEAPLYELVRTLATSVPGVRAVRPA